MRDITLEDTVYFNFTTRAFATGIPTQLAGSPVLSVLESNNATPITAGVSVDVDRASVTGLNQATVVATAANGYEAGKSYCVYISTGTVGGVSVVGEVVAQFTVQAGAAFTRLGAPAGASVSADIAAVKTQTAAIEVDTQDIQGRLPAALVGGRIDANAGAISGDAIAADNLEAALDGTGGVTITAALTGNITGDLSGSVGSVTGAVGSVTGNVGGNVTGSVGSVTGAVGSVTGNVGGNVTGSVGSVAAGGIAATSFAAGAIDAAAIANGAIDRATFAADTGLQSVRSNTAQAGAATTITLDASASATDDIYNNHLVYLTGGTGAGQARYITAYNGTTKVATVATWTTNPDATSTFAILPGDAIAGASAPTAAQVADAVWDEALAGHLSAGSTGEALNAAGAAGDPWITTLPGSYTSGQAGHTVGTYLTGDAYTRLGAPAGASHAADIAAVKTDTGNLVTRITSTLFSGITSLAQWLGLLAGKQTGDATARTELRATGAGSGTFDETTDSQEALRDRGDAAWVTATGFATAANLATMQGNVTDILADTNELQTDWVNGGRLDLILDSIPTATQNADALLNRDMSAVSDTNARSPLNALRFIRNKWSIAGTTLTVTKEDDTTSAWTATVSTNASAEPVVGNDPA